MSLVFSKIFKASWAQFLDYASKTVLALMLTNAVST